ncbi:MAG: hypothetical protein PUC65_03420 [Clostridiales bacterium]|nr:hypothetical protein [Clostridiales bacterium]
MFRSYNAFSPKIYKAVMWIIYPFLAIICCILVQNGCFGLVTEKGYHYMVSANLLCSSIVIIEVMGDYWLFSGIQSKNANHMDFLKSSKRGRQFFRDAIVSDIIRRFTVIVVLNVANLIIGTCIFNYQSGGIEGILLITTYGLCCYTFSTFAVFISRYGQIWYINMGIGYIGNVVAMIAILIISTIKLPLWIWVFIYCMSSIVVTILAVKVAIKKVEDSYYDQRS